MLDKFVANLLTSYLGKYIANLDKQHVKVSVWNGHVVLHDLTLKTNALRYLNMPVSIKEGRIGELSVVIPWTRLQSEAVKIEIKDIVIIIHPKKAAGFDAEQEALDAQELKDEELSIFEALRKATATTNEGTSAVDTSEGQTSSDVADSDPGAARDSSFTTRLKATMLNNVELHVRNVVVQYEDIVTDPERPICMTVSVGSFSVVSCDENFRAAFCPPNSRWLFKLAELLEVSMWVETFPNNSSTTPTAAILGDARGATKATFAGRTCAELEASISGMDQRGELGIEASPRLRSSNSTRRGGSWSPQSPSGIASGARTSGDFASSSNAATTRMHYVLQPVNFVLRLRHQPVPFQPQLPRWSATIEMDEAVVHLNRAEWDAVWQSIKYVQRFHQYKMYLPYRPNVSIRVSPVAWWRFAVSSVLHLIRERRKRRQFDWNSYRTVKAMEREYMQLHKRAAPHCPSWATALNAEEVARHRWLESQMPVESIKMARSLAYARLNLEAEQQAAREEFLARRQTAQPKKKSGWWAWWAGSSASVEPVAETEEDAKEIEKLWGLIDAERWSDEQRRVIARELGMEVDDVGGSTGGGSGSPLSSTTGTSNSASPLTAGSPTGNAAAAASNSGSPSVAVHNSSTRQRSLHAFAKMHAVFVELLDYDNRSFATLSLENLSGSFRTLGASDYEFMAHLSDFSVYDEDHAAAQRAAAAAGATLEANEKNERSSTSADADDAADEADQRHPIVRIARERLPPQWLRQQQQQQEQRAQGSAAATAAVGSSPTVDAKSKTAAAAAWCKFDGADVPAVSVSWIPLDFRPPENVAVCTRFATNKVLPSASSGGVSAAAPRAILDSSDEDFIAYKCLTSLAPLDVRASVPWLQRVVRFWGVSTNLVDDDAHRSTEGGGGGGGGPQQGRRPAPGLRQRAERQRTTEEIMREVESLLTHVVERRSITAWTVCARDFCLVIPESVVEQECRLHVEKLQIENAAAKAAERKRRLAMASIRRAQAAVTKSPSTGAFAAASPKWLGMKQSSSVFGAGIPVASSFSPLLLGADGQERSPRSTGAAAASAQFISYVLPDDYVNQTHVSLTKLSIYTSWRGSFDATLVEDTTVLLSISQSLVHRRLDVPLMSIEVMFPSRVVFQSPLEGYAVFFSALTAVTDFANNASGRGTKHHHSHPRNAPISSDPNGSSSANTSTPSGSPLLSNASAVAEFFCLVKGPQVQFLACDESTLTPQQQYYASRKSECFAQRLVTVARGILTVFHQKRPSMKLAKVELKSDAVHMVRRDHEEGRGGVGGSSEVVLFIKRGGRHHMSAREHLFDARALLAQHLERTVEQIRAIPLPQLRSLIADYIANKRPDEDTHNELLGCYSVIKEAAETVPCYSLTFRFATPSEAKKFESTITSSLAAGGMPRETITTDEAREILERLIRGSGLTADTFSGSQRVFDVVMVCPQGVNLRVRPVCDGDCILGSASAFRRAALDQPSTTPGHLEVVMERMTLHFYLSMFSREVVFSSRELRVLARDADRATDAVASAMFEPAAPSTDGQSQQHRNQPPSHSPMVGDNNDNDDDGAKLHQVIRFSAPAAAAEPASTRQEINALEDGVLLTFSSSSLTGVTSTIRVDCTGATEIVVDAHFAAASELLWDLLGVMTMKEYECTTCRGVPWRHETDDNGVDADILGLGPLDLSSFASSVVSVGAMEQSSGSGSADGLDRLVLDLHCTAGVFIDLRYERRGGAVQGEARAGNPSSSSSSQLPPLPAGSQAAIRGRSLALRWRVNALENVTVLRLEEPVLETYFSAQAKYVQFVAPKSRRGADSSPGVVGSPSSATPDRGGDEPPPASLQFQYRVTYLPPGLSPEEWKQQCQATNGYHFTHFMTIAVENALCRFRQHDLWSLIEYTTNGLVSRLAYIAWRRAFGIHQGQFLWPPPAEVSPPSFGTQLLHKHIEIQQCDLCLPHHPQQAPQLWASVERMSMWDKTADSTNSHAAATPTSYLSPDPALDLSEVVVDVRTGFDMNIDGLSLWAAKPAVGQHKVTTMADFREEDVLHKPEAAFVDLVVHNLALRYFMWFDATGMKRNASQKTIGFEISDLPFHGSSEQLALVLDWVSGTFLLDPWTPRYAPKQYPVPPYPNLAEREGRRPWVTYDFDIRVDRLMLHLRDPAIHYPTTPSPGGPMLDRQPINVVCEMRNLSIALQWLSDGSFSSEYTLGSLDGWDLLRTAWKTGSVDLFVKSPREVVSAQQNFLRLRPASASHGNGGTDGTDSGDGNHSSARGALADEGGDAFPTVSPTTPPAGTPTTTTAPTAPAALRVTFGWNGDAANKTVRSTTRLPSVEVDLIPKFLFDLRDSLLSLRVRNAFAPLCRWPQVLPYVPLQPWNPRTQEWSTQHNVVLDHVTLVLFDGTHRKPQPVFFVTLDDVRVCAHSSVFRTEETLEVVVQQIGQNGVCDEALRGRPLVVPQSQVPTAQNDPSASPNTKKPRHLHSNHTAPKLELLSQQSGCAPNPLFWLSKRKDTGISGSFGSVWIFSPPKEDLRRLRAALSDESLRELQWISCYAEERFAVREHLYVPYQNYPAAVDSPSNDIRFTLCNPALVVSEHETMMHETSNQRGIVINGGLLDFKSTFQGGSDEGSTTATCDDSTSSPRGATSPRSPKSPMKGRRRIGGVDDGSTPAAAAAAAAAARRNYCFTVEGGHLRSLHRSTQHLIKPTNVTVRGCQHSDGTLEVHVAVQGVTVDVALEYYESVLRSIVRHSMVDEEQLVQQKAAAASSTASVGGGGGGSAAASVRSTGRSSATGFSHAKAARVRRLSVAAYSADTAAAAAFLDAGTAAQQPSHGPAARRTATAGAAPGAATSGGLIAGATRRITVHVEWEHFRLRVYSDSIAVTFSMGQLDVYYRSESRPREEISKRALRDEEEDLWLSIEGTAMPAEAESAFSAAVVDEESGRSEGGAMSSGRERLDPSLDRRDSDTTAREEEEGRHKNSGSSAPSSPLATLQQSSSRPQLRRHVGSSKQARHTKFSDEAFAMSSTPTSPTDKVTHGAAGNTDEQETENGSARATSSGSPRSKRSAGCLGGSTASSSERRCYRRIPHETAFATRQTVRASLRYLRLGVDNRPPIVSLEARDAGDDGSLVKGSSLSGVVTTDADPESRLEADVEMDDQDMRIKADMGITRIMLERDSVVNSISFLYDPYRRIVLPKYTAFELKHISDNLTLSQRLILSARTNLRVSSELKNYIVINGNGHAIHFLDAGKALLILESGLTVHIINATVYLYGKPLDHYTAVGNGSYVLLDEVLCTVIRGENETAAVKDSDGGSDEESDSDVVGAASGESSSGEDDGNGGKKRHRPKLHSTSSLRRDGTFNAEDLRTCRSRKFTYVPRDSHQQIAVEASFFLLVPEYNNNNNSSSGATTAAAESPPSQQRALMLSAATTFAGAKRMQSGHLTEVGAFHLTDLEAECQYLLDDVKTDYSSLISSWALTIDVRGEKTFYGPHSRTITVSSPSGVDFRFRYGDIKLSLAAVHNATAALGHIGSNVLVTAAAASVQQQHEFALLEDGEQQQQEKHHSKRKRGSSSGQSPLGGRGRALDIITTTVRTSIPRIGLYLVDDSSSMDFPLFYASMTNVATPTCEHAPPQFKLHLNFSLQVEYYNFYASLWARLLEPIDVDVAVRDVQNRSLQDVQARRGERKAGLRVSSIRLHVTPMVADALSRTLKLMSELGAAPPPSSSSATATADGVEAAAAATANTQVFYAYEVTQQLGSDVVIGFAQDDHGRFPAPRRLHMLDVFAFNFPRIEGRELPTSQHYITISTDENSQLLRISQVGLQVLTLQHGGITQDVVAEVQVRHGKKRVTLRTNIAFENHLPFPIVLAGVGSVFANSTHTVPTEAMRKRCVFVPQLPHRCHQVSMGVTYDALPNHYSQMFLCTSEIDDAKGAQKAVHFILRFATKLKISERSHLYDCRATFEAAFSVVNHTGIDLVIGLHYKQFHQHRIKTSMFDFASKYYFVPVATIPVAAEAKAPITEVDPLQDVYLDVTLVQPSGTPVARTGAKRQFLPALIRSDKKELRSGSLVLNDPHGETLVLRIEYADREVILTTSFWLVNQTPHYLQFMDSNPKKRGFLLAGSGPDGLPPSTSPFVFGSEKMERLGDKAHIYIRVGRRVEFSPTQQQQQQQQQQRSGGGTAATSPALPPGRALMWSQWSEPVLVHPIGEWSVFHCGETEPVTLSYSIQFVGGGGSTKDTRVIRITPRWILVNRTPFSLNVRQRAVRSSEDEDAEVLPTKGHRLLDVSSGKAEVQSIQLRLATVVGEIDRCQWSAPIPIEVFGDNDLNLRYDSFVRDSGSGSAVTMRRDSHVIRVSTYRRGSILFLVFEKPASPPYIIENRTPYMLHAKQRDATAKLMVYAHTTKGFVWDDNSQVPVLTLWAAERSAASRAVNINLEASALTKRSNYQLQQELVLPGGVVLFVRVRALGGSFAISVTLERAIDKMRTLPFFQFRYQVHVESVYLLVSSTTADTFLVTVKPIRACVSQRASATREDDERTIEISTSVVQIDDERPDAKQRVVMQLLDTTRPSSLVLQCRMQRLTPIIIVSRLEFLLQPIEIHVEDSFLFHVTQLVTAFQDALGATHGDKKSCVFDVAPWSGEVDPSMRPSSSEDALGNKVAFIEKLLVEQIVLSLSLYRAHDSRVDPIREKLGVLSVLIRSVQDARIDWRRVEQSNIYDRIWLLGTLYSNFYMHTLQQQVLNVLHVAGLDQMRGFVTDLLQQYFSSTVTTHIDRSRPKIPRRSEAKFLDDAEAELRLAALTAASPRATLTGADSSTSPTSPNAASWDVMEDAAQVAASSRWLRFGSSSTKTLVSVEVMAYQVSWMDFFDQVTNSELRTYGHHALCHAIRTRSLSPSSVAPSLCTRCVEIDRMRHERMESGSMSALPHPDTQVLQWAEFTHHVSWDEFVAICTPNEVRRFAHLVRDAIMGTPNHVVRIDAGLMWCVTEDS